jgi:hypothetical protein
MTHNNQLLDHFDYQLLILTTASASGSDDNLTATTASLRATALHSTTTN